MNIFVPLTIDGMIPIKVQVGRLKLHVVMDSHIRISAYMHMCIFVPRTWVRGAPGGRGY